jgi:hypothetical protein
MHVWWILHLCLWLGGSAGRLRVTRLSGGFIALSADVRQRFTVTKTCTASIHCVTDLGEVPSADVVRLAELVRLLTFFLLFLSAGSLVYS